MFMLPKLNASLCVISSPGSSDRCHVLTDARVGVELCEGSLLSLALFRDRQTSRRLSGHRMVHLLAVSLLPCCCHLLAFLIYCWYLNVVVEVVCYCFLILSSDLMYHLNLHSLVTTRARSPFSSYLLRAVNLLPHWKDTQVCNTALSGLSFTNSTYRWRVWIADSVWDRSMYVVCRQREVIGVGWREEVALQCQLRSVCHCVGHRWTEGYSIRAAGPSVSGAVTLKLHVCICI